MASFQAKTSVKIADRKEKLGLTSSGEPIYVTRCWLMLVTHNKISWRGDEPDYELFISWSENAVSQFLREGIKQCLMYDDERLLQTVPNIDTLVSTERGLNTGWVHHHCTIKMTYPRLTKAMPLVPGTKLRDKTKGYLARWDIHKAQVQVVLRGIYGQEYFDDGKQIFIRIGNATMDQLEQMVRYTLKDQLNSEQPLT